MNIINQSLTHRQTHHTRSHTHIQTYICPLPPFILKLNKSPSLPEHSHLHICWKSCLFLFLMTKLYKKCLSLRSFYLAVLSYESCPIFWSGGLKCPSPPLIPFLAYFLFFFFFNSWGIGGLFLVEIYLKIICFVKRIMWFNNCFSPALDFFFYPDMNFLPV